MAAGAAKGPRAPESMPSLPPLPPLTPRHEFPELVPILPPAHLVGVVVARAVDQHDFHRAGRRGRHRHAHRRRGEPVGGAVEQQDGTAHQPRSEEHTSELQSLAYLVCRLLLEKKKRTPHSYQKRQVSRTATALSTTKLGQHCHCTSPYLCQEDTISFRSTTLISSACTACTLNS